VRCATREGTRLRVGPRKRTVGYVEEAGVTGWDIAGYRGPLTWEQEEKRRAEVQKIHWHDNIEDLVVRYRPKPPKK